MPVLVRLVVLAFPLALAIACSGGEGGSPPPGGEGGSGGAGGTGGAAPVAGALHGTVLLVDGAPAVGATVTLPGREAVVVGADGAYAFDELPPGSHDLSFSLAPYRSEARAVAVEVGADAEVAPVVLQRVIAIDADRLSGDVARSFAGSRLLFCAGRDQERKTADAWLWDDAVGERRLATALDESLCYSSRSGAFSPDDRFLIFPLSRPYPEDEEWTLVECETGEERSLGVLQSHEFWPDASRLVWTARPAGEPASVRTLALPVLEETVLCEPGGGMNAVASDRGALVCGVWADGEYPDLFRWDLASSTSEPMVRDGRILGITPELDRALVLGGTGTGVLWRRGREPVTLASGVEWSVDASCDEAVEKGFLLASGELFRLDLVAGTTVPIDQGVDVFYPAPSREQVFYYKELSGTRGRLFSWDERSGVSRELGDGVPASSWAPRNDWPRAAAFVTDADPLMRFVGDLHLDRFDGTSPRRIGTRAYPERLDAAGLAFFHDVDATGLGSFSILAPGAEAPTPVLTGVRFRYESGSYGRAPTISPGMDRVLGDRTDPETGRQGLVAWSRERGERFVGGQLDKVSPSFDRVLALEAGPGGYYDPGPLRIYDFVGGELRTLGDRVANRWCDERLDRIVFANRAGPGEGSVLQVYDHASGEVRQLLEHAVSVAFWPNQAWTHALIASGLGGIQDVYLADLASGRVERVAVADWWDRWPRSPDGNQVLLVDVGYDVAPASGRLLLLDLPAMTATVLDDAAAPAAPWVNGDFSAIVYRRDLADPSPESARDTVGELRARALRPGASSYRVDGDVRGVLLGTAGWFLYEVAGQGIRAGEWPR